MLNPMETRADISRASAQGIRWIAFLPAAALLGWSVALSARENPWTFLDWVNLAFHEAGHLFLTPFGETLHFLGGTVFQLLVPIGLTVHFLLKGGPFSASACFWWFGQNFLGIAHYMADARDLKLPLVGGGENDWNHLFYQWGMLGEGAVRRISSTAHGIGVVVMVAASLWMGFLALPPGKQEALLGGLVGRFPRLQILVQRGQ